MVGGSCHSRQLMCRFHDPQLPGFWYLATQISIDVYITVMLCHILRHYTPEFSRWIYPFDVIIWRQMLMYQRTNAIVERLTAYAIRRGVLMWYV